jgi:MFS family permease
MSTTLTHPEPGLAPETTPEREPTAPAPAYTPDVSRPKTRAALAIFCHFVIDAFSFVGVALLPLLAVTLSIRPEQKALLLALGSVSSGVIQPFIAWASDKLDTRALGTLGFVVAVLAIANLGTAQNFTQLAILYALGTMGVGAFHPPAAATIGQLGAARRSLFIALFFLAGMLGGITGNVLTPRYVDLMTPTVAGTPDPVSGILALRWFIPAGLACAVVLALAIHKVGHRRASAKDTHIAMPPAERRARWRAVWILYAANVLRFSVNMALVYLFTEWASAFVLANNPATTMTESLGINASRINGNLQASMQLGMGLGGILLGLLLAPRFEKAAFVTLPILGAIMIALIPSVGRSAPSLAPALVMLAAVVSGLGFGAVIPVSISLAQRLLPHRTSLASGIMLGGAWTLAFVGPIAAELVQNGIAHKPTQPGFLAGLVNALPFGLDDKLAQGMGLDAAFLLAAIALACAGLFSLLLPQKLIVHTAHD